MSSFLIVDDNLPTGRVLARLLEYEGHEVAFVASGREALAFLERQHPNILILDWMMPDMDGPDVLRAVRSDRRFDDMRVVMFSAVSEPNRIGDTLKLGGQDFILKGTPWKTLYSRLRELAGDRPN